MAENYEDYNRFLPPTGDNQALDFNVNLASMLDEGQKAIIVTDLLEGINDLKPVDIPTMMNANLYDNNKCFEENVAEYIKNVYREITFPVLYKGVPVGYQRADFVVHLTSDEYIIIELKAVKNLSVSSVETQIQRYQLLTVILNSWFQILVIRRLVCAWV